MPARLMCTLMTVLCLSTAGCEEGGWPGASADARLQPAPDTGTYSDPAVGDGHVKLPRQPTVRREGVATPPQPASESVPGRRDQGTKEELKQAIEDYGGVVSDIFNEFGGRQESSVEDAETPPQPTVPLADALLKPREEQP